MRKKSYQAPCIQTMQILQANNILAASGEAPKVTIKQEEEISSGFVGAKGFTNKDLWEDD